MADIQQILSASTLIITGKGLLTGVIASVSTPASHATLTCYDNTAASGTIIFQVEVYADQQPFTLFFSDRFAPRFSTGLYLTLDADLVVNLWASDR
mgnify:CR=1 FL=1